MVGMSADEQMKECERMQQREKDGDDRQRRGMETRENDTNIRLIDSNLNSSSSASRPFSSYYLFSSCISLILYCTCRH